MWLQGIDVGCSLIAPTLGFPSLHPSRSQHNFSRPTPIRNVSDFIQLHTPNTHLQCVWASPYMLNVQVSSHTPPGRPFSRYESHYAVPIGRKKHKAVSEADEAIVNKVRSKHATRKVAARKADARVDPHLDEQFATGRLYGETMVAVTVFVGGVALVVLVMGAGSWLHEICTAHRCRGSVIMMPFSGHNAHGSNPCSLVPFHASEYTMHPHACMHALIPICTTPTMRIAIPSLTRPARSCHCVAPWPERPLRRLHPGGQGARVLHEEAQDQAQQVGNHHTAAAFHQQYKYNSNTNTTEADYPNSSHCSH